MSSRFLVSLVVLLLVLPLGAAPAWADPVMGSSSCTAGGVTWRVAWTVSDSVYGPLARVIGLTRSDDSGTSDAGGLRWELRWDNLPDQWPPSTPPAVPFQHVTGTLGGTSGVGDRPVATYLSPRLVAPDGGCQVYLSPYANAHGQPGLPRVAVLGDSLLQQLNDSAYNAAHGVQGYVEGNLNTAGLLAEVEGQGGRRWTDSGGTGLARADGYLLDEFRGLAEHETSGYVVALGANDALHVALGATQQERDARWAAVYDKLVAVLGEMIAGTGCLVAITAPQHGNSYSTHYAAQAARLNDVLRWIAAANGSDSFTLIDFAAEAGDHQRDAAQPWFDSDNLHLNPAGRLVYTAGITEAARRCQDASPLRAMQVYGAPGTFGTLTDGGTAPTGQPIGASPVTGWDVPPGQSAFFSAVAADGTIFTAGLDHNAVFFFPTADDSVIMSFDPARRAYGNIRIRSTTGATHGRHPPASPGGSSIADLQAIDGGHAIAFTVFAPNQSGHDGQGVWPTFGILTKSGGSWQVASGNQWTAAELRDSNPALGRAACGDTAPYCRGMNEMSLLPASQDLVVAQYTSGTGEENKSGAIVVLRVEGPDAAGRYTARIRGHYQLPRFPNPQTAAPDDFAELSVLAVEADPTGTLGDERFTAVFDAWNVHNPVMEFSYDAATGRITPVSAPLIAGDRNGSGEFWGYTASTYDGDGNLWIRRSRGFGNGPLAVYARAPGQRNAGGQDCAIDPAKGWHEYTSTRDGTTVWGLTCPPDYDILQGAETGPATGVAYDPARGDIVTLGSSGEVLAIRASGEGRGMSFSIGAFADPGRSRLPVGASPADPALKAVTDTRLGGFDASGRFFYWLGQRVGPSCAAPAEGACRTDNAYAELDQWLVTVDPDALFDPPPAVLPVEPGGRVRIEAEHTSTTGTTLTQGATITVDSHAYVHKCMWGWGASQCADKGADNSYQTEGRVLADDTGTAGHPGTPVTYRVFAPRGGEYQIAYRARMRGAATGRIHVRAGSTAYPATTVTEGGWGVTTGPVLTLAPGENILTLSAPPGEAGWYLNWFTLTRRSP
ncbi:GDSL-type esterase/lipase family protein [Nonomuraea rubra]